MTAIGTIGACMVIIIVHVTFPFWQGSRAHQFMARHINRFVRSAYDQVRSVWSDATRIEKAALLLFFVPIPGPVDEIIALLVVRRIVRRRSRGVPNWMADHR
jgi:hypothetical protein